MTKKKKSFLNELLKPSSSELLQSVTHQLSSRVTPVEEESEEFGVTLSVAATSTKQLERLVELVVRQQNRDLKHRTSKCKTT